MYQRGKIYAIRSYQTDEVYIGSTIQPLSERLRKHRNGYKLYKEGKYDYTSSYKLLEYDDYYIELIEDYPCNRKEELNKREGQIIRATENAVNRLIAGRTKKQYREDNKEAIKQKDKRRYEDNKEVILQRNKQYREQNREVIQQYKKQKITCECGAVHRMYGKAEHFRSAKHQAYEEANNLYINVLFEE